jgi:hypothetical protein
VDRVATRSDDPRRITEVTPYEALFPVAAAHGYDWLACNVPGAPTQRLWTPDPGRALGKIDWFLTRGLSPPTRW